VFAVAARLPSPLTPPSAVLAEWARRATAGEPLAGFLGTEHVDTVFLMLAGAGPATAEVLAAVQSVRAALGARAPRFLLLTATERDDLLDRHAVVEAETTIIAAAAAAGVTVVPLTLGTVRGMESGAMRHVTGRHGLHASAWHFTDTGKLYVMQVAALALRDAERGGVV